MIYLLPDISRPSLSVSRQSYHTFPQCPSLMRDLRSKHQDTLSTFWPSYKNGMSLQNQLSTGQLKRLTIRTLSDVAFCCILILTETYCPVVQPWQKVLSVTNFVLQRSVFVDSFFTCFYGIRENNDKHFICF